MFKLKYYSGEIIQGLFYPQELQQVTIDKNQPYKIRKILKALNTTVGLMPVL
jgi:hypothetical protein